MQPNITPNGFRARVVRLVFRNGFTVIATIVIVLGGLWVLKIATFAAVSAIYSQHAKATFMKPFYDKVAQAEQDSHKVPLANFVAHATTHAAETTGKGSSLNRLANCTVPGTYFNTQTNTTLQGVRTCSYGYISYYWVDALDDTTIDNATQQMQQAGWTLITNKQDQAIQKARANSNTLGGYTFTRNDGTTAEMDFINKSEQLQNSGGFSGYPFWNFVSHTSDPHAYFLAVNVSYEAQLQGTTLLTPN